MKPRDRRAEIAALVQRTGEVGVDALAGRFGVSVETIRRDLGQLAEDGALLKVHGGAKPRGRLFVEESFHKRMQEDTDAKAAIAAKLRAEIGENDTIMIDTGSTTLIAAGELASVPGLSVITNSLYVAEAFGRQARNPGGQGRASQVFLLGGTYAADNNQTIGPDVIAQLEQYRADHAIITVAAFSADAGATDSDVAEAQIARAMIARAQNVIVLANSLKFGRRAAFRICGLEDINTLITDAAPEGPLADALAEAGVTVR